MPARKLSVLITDDRGRMVQRLAIPAWIEGRIPALAGVGAAALACLFVHSLFVSMAAVDAQRLAASIRGDEARLARLQAELPLARRSVRHAEYALARIRGESGLVSGPSILGIGPLEPSEPPVTPRLGQAKVSAKAVQRSLGDLLDYFEDAELLLQATPSINPTGQAHVTSSFGKRKHPITGQWGMHKGLDLAAAPGTPVFAPADGVVVFAGPRGGYGVTLVLDHGYSVQTHFAHLSRGEVPPGQEVRRGQIIGRVGATGRATGPHLHYEVRRMGQPLDPAAYILD
jgi:murein DD-endopeptidase MepM/ murein hydrolase activator NlpD